MGNYYSKIMELEQELEGLRNRYRVLCAHRDCLTVCKQQGVWRNQDEWELKQLEEDIPTVHKRINSISSRIWYLRKKRMEEAREFYNLMDGKCIRFVGPVL